MGIDIGEYVKVSFTVCTFCGPFIVAQCYFSKFAGQYNIPTFYPPFSSFEFGIAVFALYIPNSDRFQ